jgi:hypothetical protein
LAAADNDPMITKDSERPKVTTIRSKPRSSFLMLFPVNQNYFLLLFYSLYFAMQCITISIMEFTLVLGMSFSGFRKKNADPAMVMLTLV